jgi:hypothetical protein
MTRLAEVERTGALMYFAEPLTFSAHVTSVRFLYPGSRLDVTRKQILAVEKVGWSNALENCDEKAALGFVSRRALAC